jgi:hypothetical protein
MPRVYIMVMEKYLITNTVLFVTVIGFLMTFIAVTRVEMAESKSAHEHSGHS